MLQVPQRALISQIQLFTMEEFQQAFKTMSNRKCQDENGITLELIKYGPEELHSTLLRLFNDMLKAGRTEESWRLILFRMLPKSGNLKEATN